MNEKLPRKIILYEHTGFLSEILEQTNYTFTLNPAIKSDLDTSIIFIINDENFKDKTINALAYIFPVIVLGKTSLPELNPHIKTLTKPVILEDLLLLIEKSRNYAISIAKNIWINTTQEVLIINTQELNAIPLTAIEIKLLKYLTSEETHKTKNDILKSVFGYKSLDTNTLETHISRLRKKTEPELTIFHDGKDGYGIKFN